MSQQNPIDRVRQRENEGREPFESNREQFTQKQAELDRLASLRDAKPIPDIEPAEDESEAPSAETETAPER